VKRVGTVIVVFMLLVLAWMFGFMHGNFNRAEYMMHRWDQLREEILTVPNTGTKPFRKVLPELGLRIYYIDWDNGPIMRVTIEDIRTY